MTEITDKIKETFSKLEEMKIRLDQTKAWKICPLCKEEWTKLHHCVYFKPEETHEFICIECAESLKSFELIMAKRPLEKPFDNWPEEWISISPLRKNELSHEFFRQLKFRAPGQKENMIDWILYRDGNHLKIFDLKEKKVEMSYKNSLELWEGCRNRILNLISTIKHGKEIDKDLWGPTRI